MEELQNSREASLTNMTLYLQLADEGSPEAALLVAVAYKKRQSTQVEVLRDSDSLPLFVLDYDELAFSYMKQATEGGVFEAMIALAGLHYFREGVRRNVTTCSYWIWHACFEDNFEAGSHLLLDASRSLLAADMQKLTDELFRAKPVDPQQGLL